ncbi:MAG TPA: ATP-dependent helicase, partial [Mycobacteriales bacterium]|nr:ATP-dependent helicase [Mycobacteriales bacterium]
MSSDASDIPTGADVLAGLDPEQLEAARSVSGPLCILAGAGTGKTRTITHRIAYGVHTGQLPAGQILAVTFTARAAGEMRNRLRGLGVGGVQARTFHAAALRQLRYFAPRVLGGPMPDLVENKLRLIAQAAARCRVRSERTMLRDLAGEIEWAKAMLIGPTQFAAAVEKEDRQPPLTPGQCADVYAAYEEIKSRASVVDFEDLLLVTAAAIEEHRDVAEEMRARYRHFVIDEYQDVSPLQQRLLDAWLGGRKSICVVGDANQTIYSFAGARSAYLLDFGRRYPDATVVRLERDYRSTPQVVDLANNLMRAAPKATRLQLAGQRPEGPRPTFTEHDDEPAEAAAVALACEKLIANGTPPAEIAILFRVNAQSESYERALTDRKISYVLRGGERFFERPEVREAMVFLRGGARSVEDGTPLIDAVRDVLSSAGWSPDRPPAGGAARERWESLNALVEVAEELAAVEPQAGLRDFVAEMEQRADAQHAPTVQGVTLASLHSAKGLEWDAVFLVGLTDGTLPIQYATTDEAVDEERRLLYVGITRAREHLALSWALSRTAGGRRSRRRSRFLAGLAPESRTAPAKKPRRPQLDGADAVLFETLRLWRKAQAD